MEQDTLVRGMGLTCCRFAKNTIVTPSYLPENYVLSVQPRGGHGANKELGAVGVLARVRHRKYSGLVVDELRLKTQTRSGVIKGSGDEHSGHGDA